MVYNGHMNANKTCIDDEDQDQDQDHDEDQDPDEILDVDWINQLKTTENKYNDFYKEPVTSVIVYLLYINRENELEHIHKDLCLIDNNKGILKRDIIITFIKRYHHLFSCKDQHR